MEQSPQESSVAIGTGRSVAGITESSAGSGNMGRRFGHHTGIGTIVAGIATVGGHPGMVVQRPQESGITHVAGAAVQSTSRNMHDRLADHPRELPAVALRTTGCYPGVVHAPA